MIFDGDKANSFTAYTARIVPQTHRAPEPKCTLNPDAFVNNSARPSTVIAEIILASRAVSLPSALPRGFNRGIRLSLPDPAFLWAARRIWQFAPVGHP